MEIIQYKFFQKIRDCARVFGYHNRFTIQDITYDVDPSSVGKTPLGETTAIGAIEMINERGLKNLKMLDIGCGVGIIGLTMFKELFPNKAIVEVSFSDINFFNLNSLDRTIRLNNFSSHLNKEIYLYLSDVFQHILQGKQFDLIVSNPPDFSIENFDDIDLSGSSLGRYSANWHFHRQMYLHGTSI
jgi:2-polyprenyl-3-methyl-5-hydroxy-6-metoxy-1,4-benzoquinol methylase